MKFLPIAALLFLSLFIFAGYSMTTQCSQFTQEQSCRNSGCTWCDRCSGKEINSYGTDRCVDSGLQCAYSCSKTCGANCTSDSECPANLTDTTCFFAGRCGACKCSFSSVTCQKNATVVGQNGDHVCYFGPRGCTSSGCSVNSCTLQAGQVCDPTYGCVQCKDNCTKQNDASASYVSEFIIDRKCSGNDVTGNIIKYICSGGQCNVTKSDYVERCKNGCFDGKCREEKCNINGVQTDCSSLDGFYGSAYCKGKDVYKEYRDYGCGDNECAFQSREEKIETCRSECQNGRCFEAGAVINVTGGSAGPDATPPASTSSPSQPPQTRTRLISGGRVYNGFFFGMNSINARLQGSGTAVINVLRSNGAGTLMIEENGKIIFTTKTTGSYSAGFSDSSIRIYTTSSGWLFFMPAVYDIGNIEIDYK